MESLTLTKLADMAFYSADENMITWLRDESSCEMNLLFIRSQLWNANDFSNEPISNII